MATLVAAKQVKAGDLIMDKGTKRQVSMVRVSGGGVDIYCVCGEHLDKIADQQVSLVEV